MTNSNAKHNQVQNIDANGSNFEYSRIKKIRRLFTWVKRKC